MLNIVFASDNNYVPLLGVAITSLIKNNQNDFDKINIFIIDDGITEENKNRIELLITNPNHVLNFIKTKNLADLEVNVVGLDRNSNMNSFTTYSRLFLPSLLPKDIDKIIYLDCDILVVGSFKELWDININDYYVGGVLDVNSTPAKIRLGLKLEEDYFNAGILLINLKKWRENNVEEKFISFMIENQNRFYQHDQGILNNVFKDQFLILNPKYNLQSCFQTLDYDLAKKYLAMKEEYYSKEIVNHARKNPIVLHFWGSNFDRPWFNKKHTYRDLYVKYCEMADFREELITDIGELPLTNKLIYKSVHNPLIKLGLKMIPTSFVYKNTFNDVTEFFEKEEEKLKNLK